MPLGQPIPQMMKRIFEMAKSPKTDFAKPRRGSAEAMAAYIGEVTTGPIPESAPGWSQEKLACLAVASAGSAVQQSRRNTALLLAGKPLKYDGR